MRKFRKLLAALSLLFVSFLLATQNGYSQTSDTWSAVGPMTQARAGAAASLLSNGKLLITGGSESNGVPQASTEVFDPATGQFLPAPPMNVARAKHAAITLTTGDVLVTGGLTTGGGYSDTAEIFSAQTGTWALLEASLGTGLEKHAMATLSDGNVLIIGGESTSGPVLNLLLFKLADQSITPIGTLTTARTNAAAAATPDGRVLIAGGVDINGAVLDSTEIFTYSPDSITGAVAAGPKMSSPRANATATTTYDGVAVIGGSNGSADLGSAEIFSQWTNALRVVSGATPRSGHIAALLPKNGGILATGGTGASAVDLLQPWANSLAGAFIATTPSSLDHTNGFAAPGALGTLLAAGGAGSSANAAELYWFPTISTDQPDYAPGTPVVMTGTGFQPGEVVNLYLREWVNKMLVDPPDYSVTTDATGSFTFMDYAPTPADVGARYHLTAVGQASGFQAQTIFTDATNISTATVVTQNSTCATNTSSFFRGQTACALVDVTAISGGGGAGSFFIVWSNPSNSVVQTTTKTVPTSVPVQFTDTLPTSGSSPTGQWTVSVCKTTGCSGNNLVASSTFSLSATVATSTIATSPSVTFGQTATSTVTVSSASAAPTGSVSMTVTGGGSATCTALTAATSTTSTSTCTINYSANGVASSPYTLSASYAPSGAFTGSNGPGTLTVSAASVSATAGSYSGTFDGSSHSPTACQVTGAYIGSLTCSNSSSSVGPHVGLGTVTPTVNANGEALTNFSITPVNGSWSITATSVTATAGSYSGTFDGAAHSPSACQVAGAYIGALTCSNAPSSVGPDAGSGSVTPTVNANGGQLSDYNITTADGSWSITAAPVTATAGSYSGAFDGSSHSLSPCQITGSYAGALTCSNSPSPVGPHVGSGAVAPTVNANGETLTNFSITPVNGSWSITAAPVTATAGSYNGPYDGLAHSPAPDCEVTGAYKGSLTCANTPSSVGPNVGTGTITPTVNANSEQLTDYSITPVNGTWSITTKAITATLHANDKTYDGTATEPDAKMSCVLTGVLPIDSANVSCSATSGSFASSHVGSWTVTATVSISGSAAGNYTLGAGGSTLNSTSATTSAGITPALVTATAGNYSGTYDGSAHSISDCQVTGAYIGPLTCSNSPSSVGPHVSSGTVTPSVNFNGDQSADYTVTPVDGSYSITPAPVTATAGSYSGVYDGLSHSPTPACAITGTYTGALTCSNNPASVGPNAGSGTITPSVNYNGDQSTDYTVTPINGSYSITPAPVTATAGSYTGVYDGLDHPPTPSCAVTGTYVGPLTCTNNPSPVGPNVGSGSVSPNVNYGNDLSTNYTVTPVDGTWSITTKAITATLHANDKTYDGTATEPDGKMSCVLTGVLALDSANVSCSATSGSFTDKHVGSWTVTATVSISGPAAGNYTLGSAGTTVNSTSATTSANINPAPVTATAGSYAGAYDGSTHSPTTCQVTGTYVGGLTCSNNPSSVGPHVSSGIVSPTVNYNGELSTDYTFTPVNGSYNITPAPVTATAGSYSGVFDGLSHSPTPCAVSGLYTGALTCSDGPSSVGPGAGSGTVTPTMNFNGDTSTDYTVTSVNGSWSITKAQPSFSGLSPSQTIVFHTNSISLSGVISALPGPIYPPASETVSITINGSTSLATIGANGTFNTTFNTQIIPVSPGAYTITYNYAGDPNFLNTANTGTSLSVKYASGGVCAGDVGHQILQPINPNGTSVFNSKSTSPAKFRVCDANGASIGTPGVVQSFFLVQIVNGTATSNVNELVDSTTPDAAFRWDPTAQQWIFNINNKGLAGSNKTYAFQITLNDGTIIPFSYGLK